MGGRRDEDVVLVTTAGLSRSDDIRLRERRYMLTQLVRVVCVLLAVLLPVLPAVKLLFIAGAVVLPWLGVVAANAGPTVSRRSRPSAIVDRAVEQPERIAVEPGRVVDAEA